MSWILLFITNALAILGVFKAYELFNLYFILK